MSGITVVVDATVIIHRADAGSLGLLGLLQGWEFVVPDQVVKEVTCLQQGTALHSGSHSGRQAMAM